jgi:hypothetical protein
LESDVIDCPNGCSNGACLRNSSSNTSSGGGSISYARIAKYCEDTDAGDLPEIFGAVLYSFAIDEPIKKQTDTCVKPSNEIKDIAFPGFVKVPSSNLLIEFYCFEEGKIGPFHKFYICDCSYGKCNNAADEWKATSTSYLSLNGDLRCSGALISDSYAVYPAHCVDGVSSSSLSLIAGTSEPGVTSETSQSVQISEVIIHENYDPITMENDIALVHFSSPLVLGEDVTTENYFLDKSMEVYVDWVNDKTGLSMVRTS